MNNYMKNFNLLVKKSLVIFLLVLITFSPLMKFEVYAQGYYYVGPGTDGQGNQVSQPTGQSTGQYFPAGTAGAGQPLNVDGPNETGLEGAVEQEVNEGAARYSQSNNPGASNSSGNSPAGTVADPSKNGTLPTQNVIPAGSPEQAALTEALTCTIGGLLARILSNAISGVLNQIFGTILNLQVPIIDPPHRIKEVGLTIWGIPIVPSWDAIAYCLANTIITYVADSTIAWIQSGFEGKPAFVDDPTKLFNDIADYEMSSFLENLGGGFLCEPFEPFITASLVNNYSNRYSDYGKCTLDTVEGNIEDYINGGFFSYDNYFAMSQNPANNPYGSYIMAQQEARNRISAGIGPVRAELNWGNGYFSWRAADGTKAGKIVTPGKVVETQLEKRLGLAPDRLVLAEKFDQVISALVNYLIKTALTETLGAVRGITN
jgi:hypothetical protein